MFQVIKSVLKSIELYLTLKNKKFYYDLYKEFKEREQKLVQEIENLRMRGDTHSADRADLLRGNLNIYQPSTLRLEKGKQIQTIDGIYTPQSTEVWHSDSRFRRLERQIYNSSK